MNLNDIAILNMSGVDYGCVINRISKSEAINLIRNIDLSKRSGTLKNILTFANFKEILTFGDIEI